MKVADIKTMGCLFILLIGLFPGMAQSHQTSTSYLSLNTGQEGEIVASYQVKIEDLSWLIDFDENNDLAVSWGEVKQRKPALTMWLQQHLILTNEAQSCGPINLIQLLTDAHFNEPYLVMDFSLNCQQTKELVLTYTGLYDLNNKHKLIVDYQDNDQRSNRIMHQQQQQISFSSQQPNHWLTLVEYIYQGVVHILIGLDHVLFVLCLLLAAVLRKNQDGSIISIKATIWHVLALVTTFTLAHSVTLILTATHWLSFSSRWVEIIIATTVALTALHNLSPFIKKLVLVTFVFGLFHGMGFAGVLGELGLPSNAKLLPVLGFNVGVELGQIMIIAILLPVLLVIQRKSRLYETLFKTCSLLILLLACYWVAVRY